MANPKCRPSIPSLIAEIISYRWPKILILFRYRLLLWNSVLLCVQFETVDILRCWSTILLRKRDIIGRKANKSQEDEKRVSNKKKIFKSEAILRVFVSTLVLSFLTLNPLTTPWPFPLWGFSLYLLFPLWELLRFLTICFPGLNAFRPVRLELEDVFNS